MSFARRPLPHAVLLLCTALSALLSLAQAPGPPGSEHSPGGPSLAIFPPQSLPLRFDHERHVLGLHMPCTACHDGAKTSTKSRDRLLPDVRRCDGCHGSDHTDLARVKSDPDEPMARCDSCHLGYRPEDGNRVARLVVPEPNLKFNHALHLEQRMSCSDCHAGVEKVDLATRAELPRMRGCLRCHGAVSSKTEQRTASGDCATCHLTEGGRLATRFASGELLPPSWLKNSAHDPGWVERHQRVAGDDGQFCANCHSEKYCADCHDGRVRPRRVHPNDYLSLHPIAARHNQPNCASCHRLQSFCVGCHQRLGITLSGPVPNVAGRGRFHPPKSQWTDGPRSPGHHAWEAQRNLNACISCHVERDCAICHSTQAVGGRGGGLPAGGGQGVNPHPSGFRSHCARAMRRNARSCVFCHGISDPNLESCR